MTKPPFRQWRKAHRNKVSLRRLNLFMKGIYDQTKLVEIIYRQTWKILTMGESYNKTIWSDDEFS